MRKIKHHPSNAYHPEGLVEATLVVQTMVMSATAVPTEMISLMPQVSETHVAPFTSFLGQG
jgi:hypothetical protein